MGVRGNTFQACFDSTIAKNWNQLEGWLVTGRWWVLPPSLGAASKEKAASTATNPKHPPCKAPKIQRPKIFPNFQRKTARHRVMLKIFGKAVEDDYIMKFNRLPQL